MHSEGERFYVSLHRLILGGRATGRDSPSVLRLGGARDASGAGTADSATPGGIRTRISGCPAVEALLGATVDLVQRSVRPERREAELANLVAVADEVVGGIRGRPWGD